MNTGDHNSLVMRALVLDHVEAERTVSFRYLLQLTCCSFGIQVVGSTIMSQGTHHLLSLGFSKPLVTLAWLAAPLSGAIFQPLAGAYSDRCDHEWGQRKPYMIYGSACTVISLLALSWTEEIADWIYTVLSRNSGEIENNATYSTFRIAMAMFWIYILYPSIAVVQSSIKAFIVDNCPSHQQVHAAAWSARLQGLGSILGYLTGTGNAILPFAFIVSLGFKSASVVACFALTISVAISTIFVSGESVHPQSNRQLLGLVSFFNEIWRDMMKLPASIKHICLVQFFAWMGWFPFLFYATAYVSQQYTTNYVSSRDTNTNVVAIRIGSIATFLFSVVSFLSILILPLMASKAPQQTIGWTKAPIGSDEKSTSRMISLQHLWAFSHALFTICMFSTIFVQSPTAAAIPVAVVGISGGINSWAPHALVNLEIVRLQADDILEGFTEDDVNGGDSTCPRTPAGVILGLHNVAISVPQIIAAFGCWVLTQVLQKVGVSDEFGWMFRFASIATVTATYLAWKLK